MQNCTYEWIGLYQWWYRMDASGQAAWVQAIGAILAIIAAILIPYFQRQSDQKSKKSIERKIVMSAAANLAVTLNYASTKLNFAPAGDGLITHELTLEQASQFLKLGAETRVAFESAIDKSHLFDDKLCQQIVLLSIETAAYERIVDQYTRFSGNADDFLKAMQGTKNKISVRFDEVRKLLKDYLPQTS